MINVKNVRFSLINNVSDETFVEIIKNNHTWKELAISFGYKSTRLSTNVRNAILERCKALNVEFCYYKAKPIGERTKGEVFSEFKNWQSARSFIRRNAKETYVKYGKTLCCEICGYDKHVEIAHIKAVSDFSQETKIEEINSIDNLIALCPNHHWEFDNGLLKLQSSGQ
jgi:hypothetical protein